MDISHSDRKFNFQNREDSKKGGGGGGREGAEKMEALFDIFI
jgi:hypothetical protein